MKKTTLLRTVAFMTLCLAIGCAFDAQGAELGNIAKLELLYDACVKYKDKNGCYPPAYLVDDHGVKGDDWFALLKPYLNAQEDSITGVAAIIDPRGVFAPTKDARQKNNGVKTDVLEKPEEVILFVSTPDTKESRKSLTIKEILDQLKKEQTLAYITADGKLHPLASENAEEVLTRQVACVDVYSHLKAAALACHMYYDSESRLPAVVTYDADGKEKGNWRDDVEKIFSKAPELTKSFGSDITGIAMIVSDDGAFTGKPNERGKSLAAITDGLANTAFFLELPNPKSERLAITVEEFYNQLQNCPEETQGYYVGMGDGSVKFINKDLTIEDLKALVSCSGGEMIDF